MPTRYYNNDIYIHVFLIDETFEKSKKEMYQYETLGGNNSRVALQALSNEENSHPAFRTRLVSVYSGLSDDEAVRLAAKHNRTTSFYHATSTWDKVNPSLLHMYIMNADFHSLGESLHKYTVFNNKNTL